VNTLQRHPDWPERLAAFVESRRHVPFAWGSNDCATFAADALVAMTGADPIGPLRGRWGSQDQARQVLQGFGGLARAAGRALGRPLPQLAAAPRGAVVCARAGGLPMMGLHMGAWWCGPGADGLVFRPAREVRLAWGV
jgi:hypothetical protein